MYSDISDLIKDLRKVAVEGSKVKSMMGKGRNDSIRRRAKNSIMQFPLLVSSSLNRDSVMVIKKALEMEYSILVRLSIAMDNNVNISDPNGKSNFIAKFHSNSGANPNSTSEKSYDAARIGAIASKQATLSDDFRILNMDNLVPFTEDLESGCLNDLTIRDVKVISEAETAMAPSGSTVGGVSSQLVSTDIKKANDAVPTIIQVDVEYTTGSGAGDSHAKTAQMLIGVQCVAHLVPTEEMTYFIGRSVKEENLIFRAIQWTTGEIKFFKDFVFMLDRIKAEALEGKSSSVKWWRKLRYMATSNRLKGFLSMGGGTKRWIPNATIVMSMEEVEHLKNTQGIDMSEGKNAATAMDVFFLLGFVIMDEIDEVAWVFDEDTKSFKHFTFEALKKEGRDNKDSDLKALVSLIGR